MAQDEAKCIIERAQMEEEELVVQKRIERKSKIQEMADERDKDTEAGEGSAPVKVSAISKKQWKEHLGLKPDTPINVYTRFCLNTANPSSPWYHQL